MASKFRSLPDLEFSAEEWTAPIALGPSDGTLRHGTFSNGMHYYVKTCKKPAARAAMALAVRIGSAVEEEHERGIAHIVEHLAFNATENYGNHDIVKFLESIGAEFGACQNAYTSCDETVYELMIPTDKPELLEQGVQVFAEFATKTRCAAEDLEKERGAVMEEWRMGNDSMGRAAKEHWKCVLKGSQYAERLPIGLEEVIQGASAETVKAFYKRWYRPCNMAAVVVGDFSDPDKVVELLKTHMETCEAGEGPDVPFFPFKPHNYPRCTAFEDREVVQSQVHISFKQSRPKCSTPEEYKEYLKEQLFHSMLNNRLFKVSRQEHPPFYSAQSSSEPLSASVQTLCVSASVAEGTASKATNALLTELARVRLHGFSKRELKIAQQHMLSEAETTYLQRDQSYSQDVCEEYVRHFLSGELVVGPEEEAQLTKTFLPKFELDDFQPLAVSMSPHSSCVIKTVEHRRVTSEDELQHVIAHVDELEGNGFISQWEQDDVPENILDSTKLTPGKVVSRKDYPKLGATELCLSNGMRCCCKHTKLLEDQVLLTGFACGGLTEIPKEDFRSASLASVIAGELGIFGHKPAVTNDILAGKRVDIKPKEGAFWRSFSGDQSPEDFEIALQLVYQLFTSRVEAVESELRVVMDMTRESIAAQIRDPMYKFTNRVRYINYGQCYYFAPFTMNDFRGLKPKVSCRHFNSSYHNPAEFTICLTGNVDVEESIPLIEKYLASIPMQTEPAKMVPKQVTALPYFFPDKNVVEEVFVPMVSPITQAQVTFPVAIDRNEAREEAVWISISCRLMETRLMQLMRFKFGEVYTVSVSPFFGATAPSTEGIVGGDIAFSFSCDPANASRLIELALQEVCHLQEDGPTEEEVQTVLTLEQRQHELQQEENSFWHEQLVGGYQSRTFYETEDLDNCYDLRVAAREKVIGAAGADSVKVALRRLLPYPATKRYTAITMQPKRPLLLRLVQPVLAAKARFGWGGVAVGLAVVSAGLLIVSGAFRRRS